MHEAPAGLRDKLQHVLDTTPGGDFALFTAVYDVLFPKSEEYSEADLARPLEELIRPDAPQTKYTPTVVGKMLEHLRAGMVVEHACQMAGISKDTHYTWYSDPRKAIYRLLVDKAIADNVLWHVGNIQEKAKTQWTASAWTLERRFPEHYGQRQVIQQQHSGPNGGPIVHTHQKLEDASAKVLEYRKKLLAQSNADDVIDGEVINREDEPWRP